MCPSFPFAFVGGFWDLIVLIPDHCLSFNLPIQKEIYLLNILAINSILHNVMSLDSLAWIATSLNKFQFKLKVLCQMRLFKHSMVSNLHIKVAV